jgi:hypothetical protein
MRVKSAHFVHAVNMPGTEVLSALTLGPDKYKKTRLTLKPEGLLIETTANNAATQAGLVPLANIQVLILANDYE